MTSLTPPFRHASDQLLDLQIIRPDAFDGRQDSLQDVIFALESAGALQRQHIQGFFDHADQAAIAPGRFADLHNVRVRLR